MSITSFGFLFFFLPVSVIAYYIANDRAKEYILLAISILFYSIGSLKYSALFIIAIVITTTIGRLMGHTKTKKVRKLLIVIGVIFNLSILAYYKYADFAIKTVNDVFRKNIAIKSLLLPMGISFFTFKAISYLADIYKGTIEIDKNPVHDALYLSFFPQIQSGPLSRYNDNKNQMIALGYQDRTALIYEGIFRFVIGFNKKVLISNTLANITDEIFAAPTESFSVSYAWLGSICYSLQLLFDFSGYSDMAIGISEMFGYRCPENFNYPYMIESVSRFWRRWHISLSSWFRDYIYIPMGGSKSKNRIKVYGNLFVVWLATGIWHGAAWTFIVWGLGYFVVISFEKMTGLPDRIKNKAFRIIYRVITLLFINIQWVFFRADNIKHGLRFIKRLFICEDNALADKRTWFLFREYFVIIVAAIILCCPVIKVIDDKASKNKKVYVVFQVMYAIVLLALFIISLSFVAAGKNNPFAYANF